MSSHQRAGHAVSEPDATLEPVRGHTSAPNVDTVRRTAEESGVRRSSHRAVAAVLMTGDLLALALTATIIGDAHARGVCLLLAVVTSVHTFRRVPLDLRVDAVLGPLLGIVVVATVAVAAVVPSDVGLLGVSTAAILALSLSRTASHALLRHVRRRGGLRDQVLIIGAGDAAAALVSHFDDHPGMGLDPVVDLTAPIGDQRHATRDRSTAPATRLGHVIVTSTPDSGDLTGDLRGVAASGVSVFLVPRLPDLAPSGLGSRAEEIAGIPLLRLRPAPHRTVMWSVKRFGDRVVAATGLIVLSPLLLGIALVIRLGDVGPVLFRQVRLGRGGEEFEILKFRTMAVNPDSDVTWNVHGDNRITPIGRVLRRTNLDELPQLLNVLRGDMSLVGPRPERPFFAATFSESIPSYADRHRVPVGVTGLAQVHGLRGDTSIAERSRLDNRYIDDWSLWRDCRILFMTAGQILRRGSD